MIQYDNLDLFKKLRAWEIKISDRLNIYISFKSVESTRTNSKPSKPNELQNSSLNNKRRHKQQHRNININRTNSIVLKHLPNTINQSKINVEHINNKQQQQ